ncbi:hypothetical protein BDD12DRAFT_803373 [Trichophaea hybrida]|nr:hypothetical protein BDD12DRAFT_803373 [Trichophaea hybrida]
MAFSTTGIHPFSCRTVLANTKERTALKKAAESEAALGFEVEKIPYTKCELRMQTNQALRFSETATPGEICNYILHFSHTTEYYKTEAEIVQAETQNLRREIKKTRPNKKDMRQLGKGNLAGVMTGNTILEGMLEREQKKAAEKLAAAERKAKRVAKAVEKASKVATPYTPRAVQKNRQVRFEYDKIPSTVPRHRHSTPVMPPPVNGTIGLALQPASVELDHLQMSHHSLVHPAPCPPASPSSFQYHHHGPLLPLQLLEEACGQGSDGIPPCNLKAHSKANSTLQDLSLLIGCVQMYV